MFIDDEFEQAFRRMSNSFFNIGDVFESFKEKGTGPFYYGYTMTVGPDGKPIVKEYGNIKPGLVSTSGVREPVADVVADERTVKIAAEMPGVEKADIKVVVQGGTVQISASRDDKKYRAKVPIRHKVDENSARASYKNGTLEVTFSRLEEKPQGRTVEVG